MSSGKTHKFESVPTKDPEDDGNAVPETDPDFMCGIFGYRPPWLQRFAKAYYFLLFYTLFGIFQGALKAYLNGCISTLEKKFGLTGKTFGVILIADNISALFASLLIGYYATKISRPKIIAFGVWVSVLGCFCSVLPYIIYGPGFINQGGPTSGAKSDVASHNSRAQLKFCTAAEEDFNEGASSVTGETPAPTAIVAVCLLFLANFLNGIGGTAFYISGATYTDDNVKKKNSPVYFSLIMSLRLVGPMLGYVSASVCLSIYESPFEKPGITRKHPNWIGAWWLGFVIWGGAMALMSLPMSLFPKHIRRSSVHTITENKKNEPKSLGEKIANDAREFKTAVSRLSKNPVLMWKMATLVFVINAIGGYVSMFPKYVENQYRVSASKASLFTGPTKVLAMMVGLFLGGMIIRFWKPRARTIGLLGAFADFINISFLFAGIFLGCSGWQLAGTRVENDGKLSLSNPCNEYCDCPTGRFQPICHVTQQATYFSPCAAGCLDRGNGSMECSCITEAMGTDNDAALPSMAMGFCDFPCQNLFILVFIISLGKLISQLSRVGSTLITLRCVDPADKGIAIGMLAGCLNFLGAIPYPLIYTAIFDATCLVWEDRGGRRGNCSFYDVDKLRVAYHAVTIVFMSLGLVCQLIMSYYAKRVPDMYGEAEVREGDAAASKSENGALEMNGINRDLVGKTTPPISS
ncbi:solute carrier organic anion transporter family member 74D-like [Dermacentor andersoni]|uniref:solute carrier organic anion transporter family member 74D-like n=1 Tax=Dermacentor andersoni TaxID=34620 RepID=UPI003B3A596B